ncbi:MAG: FAD:protein FMN transferase [Candidatus Omnitrophota bacterium]
MAASLLSLISVPALIWLHGCSYNPPVIEKECLLMGTVVRIQAAVGGGVGAKKADEAVDKAFEEMVRVEGIFSAYDASSEVSAVNRLAKGEEAKVSAEAFYLINRAIEYGQKTNGAFDITVKPLIDLWAKAKSEGKVPAEADIREAMEKTGPGSVMLDKSRHTVLFAKSGMALDLGGVAKGYAVARAVKVLKESGIKSAIVHAGGDMYCLGYKVGRRPWKVGIRHPRDSRAIVYELEVKDKSVDTSGDYERYFMIGNKRYSHIIDPRTGMPVGDDIVSVTVIADDPAIGDMYSTALCVLGEDGMRLAEKEGIDVALVRKSGAGYKVLMTEGFIKRYNAKEKSKL